MGQLERKVREYRLRKTQNPDNPMWSLRLADALDKSGAHEQANQEYHAAARGFLRLGFARKARSVYQRLLARNADDIDAKYGHAVADHEYEQATSNHSPSVRDAVVRFADDGDIDVGLEATLDPDDPGFDVEEATHPATQEPDDEYERRRMPRISWPANVELFNGHEILTGHGLDVSTTGLYVNDIDPVQMGEEVQLAIAVPARPWTGTGRGRVVRVDVGSRGAGIHLEWLDKLTMRHIVHSIADQLCVSPRVIRNVHKQAMRMPVTEVTPTWQQFLEIQKDADVF